MNHAVFGGTMVICQSELQVGFNYINLNNSLFLKHPIQKSMGLFSASKEIVNEKK